MIIKGRFYLSLLLPCFLLSLAAQSKDESKWPNSAKKAISLSYDDALNSQLDNAIPALNRYGFKASFYLELSSATISTRLDEWRSVAAAGHELGNHSIFHNCRASKPNRNWVQKHRDLDQRSIASIVEEINLANAYLFAIDGKVQRTYTPPCFDTLINGESYIPHIEGLFVAIKGISNGAKPAFSDVISGNVKTADELIKNIENFPEHLDVINVLFHGVGGDHLSISVEEHNKFLQYLNAHQADYWVDSYINIMTWNKAKQ
ncbi:polysaccharide deacetylase family protein [Thalassomonas sp. M1454]|uniref:polysaccharide deacetylase family protein n=1 Tax=Thalassomonas sp. M1454 TaxID=2594477 RepID=UPI00117C76AA|nr:polysaccharide deacetylase family protein [Thalassomonas sp. M1454]TRX56606.1 polysaccharide deacetylase family protein [Thalassomonas sp. M1454]